MALYINGVLAGGVSNTISSSSSIYLKPSGDTDDYFTFATASNIPSFYATGSYLAIGNGAGATGHALSASDDLLIRGKLEVDGTAYFDTTAYFSGWVDLTDTGRGIECGSAQDVRYMRSDSDINAQGAAITVPAGAGNNVPTLTIANTYANFGLLDGLTQPLVAILEKANQLTTSAAGVADAGAATAILKLVAGFTNSVVGDIVRITAGTNCTVGWYWITTVTSANQVTLDRNYTSGDTTNVTFVVFHNFPMIGADGVCLKCFDGAPDDSNTEIDRDGWTHIDVGSNLLYFRSNAVYRAVQNAKRTVEAITTTNAILEAESGSVFTNLGDADGATCTLPADAAAGTNFTFTLQAAVEFKVIVGKAASKFYLGGVISTDDGGNDLYVSADDEGESITLCCDGANGWFPLAINGTWSVTQP